MKEDRYVNRPHVQRPLSKSRTPTNAFARFASILLLMLAGHVAYADSDQQCITAIPTKSPPQAKNAVDLHQSLSIHCELPQARPCGEVTCNKTPEVAHPTSSPNAGNLLSSLAELISAIAWPIAAVVIAFALRTELANLLSRLKRGKWGNAEFEFESYVREVFAESETPRAGVEPALSPDTAALATSDPRGAIVKAWIEVENALVQLADRRGLEAFSTGTRKSNRNTMSIIRAAQRAQALDSSTVALFHDLRGMRNEAAHSTDFSPSSDAVLKYIQLASELTAAIRQAQ